MTTAEIVAHTWECWCGCTIYEPDDGTDGSAISLYPSLGASS